MDQGHKSGWPSRNFQGHKMGLARIERFPTNRQVFSWGIKGIGDAIGVMRMPQGANPGI